MILAAGLGTRMRPLTLTTPKPLIPVNGKPLIEYHLEALARAGFVDVIINHAWLGEQIEASLGCGERWGLHIQYSAETDLLETGGGIVKALPMLSPNGEPFLVINGDILTDFPFEQLLDTNPKIAHLVMVKNPPHNVTGDFGLEDGNVTNSALTVDAVSCTFSGISVLSPALFNNCQQNVFPLAPLFRRAADEKQLSGQFYSGLWMDIGTIDRLHAAELVLRKGDE